MFDNTSTIEFQINMYESIIKNAEKKKYVTESKGWSCLNEMGEINRAKSSIESIFGKEKVVGKDYDWEKRYTELRQEAISEYLKDPLGAVKFPLSKWEIENTQQEIRYKDRQIEMLQYKITHAGYSRNKDYLSFERKRLPEVRQEKIRLLAILKGEEAYEKYLDDIKKEKEQNQTTKSNTADSVSFGVIFAVFAIIGALIFLRACMGL